MYTLWHPTSMVFIDDNVHFLKSTIALVGHGDCLYLPYDNPNHAVSYVYKYGDTVDNNSFFIAKSEDDIYFSTLSLIYNPLRFLTISTVISDYDMPIVNGAEFFQKISDLNCHKVMLTGIATNALALSMIKENLISDFIRKGDFNFTDTVEDNVSRGNKFLFNNFTNAHVNMANNFKCSLKINKTVDAVIEGLFSEGDLIEYYALDEIGSYLLVDRFDEVSAIFVHSKPYIDKKYNILRQYFSADICDQLMKGELILTLPIHMCDGFEDLERFVVKPTGLHVGVKYAYVKDAEYLIDRSKITFFNAFKTRVSTTPNDHLSAVFDDMMTH